MSIENPNEEIPPIDFSTDRYRNFFEAHKQRSAISASGVDPKMANPDARHTLIHSYESFDEAVEANDPFNLRPRQRRVELSIARLAGARPMSAHAVDRTKDVLDEVIGYVDSETTCLWPQVARALGDSEAQAVQIGRDRTVALLNLTFDAATELAVRRKISNSYPVTVSELLFDEQRQVAEEITPGLSLSALESIYTSISMAKVPTE